MPFLFFFSFACFFFFSSNPLFTMRERKIPEHNKKWKHLIIAKEFLFLGGRENKSQEFFNFHRKCSVANWSLLYCGFFRLMAENIFEVNEFFFLFKYWKFIKYFKMWQYLSYFYFDKFIENSSQLLFCFHKKLQSHSNHNVNLIDQL